MTIKNLVFGTSILLAAGSIGGLGLLKSQGKAPAKVAPTDPAHPAVTKVVFEKWQTEYTNWGRWGKDDEMGTLNLVTPAKRKQAIALVKEGVTVSISSDIPMEKGP